MNFNFYIPEPILWVGATVIVLFVLKYLGKKCLPGND